MTSTNDSMSLAWLCAHYPQRIQQLFAALNLELPALAEVQRAVSAENWSGACAALLGYYRTCDSGQWLRHVPVAPGEGIEEKAEKMADAIFLIPGLEIQIPRLPSGGFNWAYVPPEDGGIEWSYGINRHDYMADVLAAFYATGNRRYARSLNEHLYDWCTFVSCPDSPELTEGACPWGTILEVGHRSKAWPAVFYGLQREDALAPATRILLLCQALDHATFLRTYSSGGSNWIITEMTGLLSIACAWPELREAAAWREMALSLTRQELQQQLYPDGVQKELSSNYQLAVLWHLGFFIDTVRGAGIPEDPAFMSLLEQMWNYLAYSLCPNGQTPQNGDSDRPESNDSQVIQPLEICRPILDAAEAYHRKDWLYIASNGARGERPPGLPSVLFPWGGQLIMRSGWEADAHWGYFDIGPWGVLHQHNDALHLSITACGRDLLVDSGRYTYQNYWGEPGTWRGYFIGSAAHNVILVDGLGQANGRRTTDSPVAAEQAFITPAYDYAQGSYTHGFVDAKTAAIRHKSMVWGRDTYADVTGDVIHTRAVLYLRGIAWVVLDRISTEHPSRITPLWHFHPKCTVQRDGTSVLTTDKGVGNLRIQPIGGLDWQLEFVSGQEHPDYQGWYSPEMNVRLPNICARYTADIPHTTTMAWLLLPGKGLVPEVKITALPAPEGAIHLLLDFPEQPVEVAMRLEPATPLRLSTGEDVVGHCGIRAG